MAVTDGPCDIKTLVETGELVQVAPTVLAKPFTAGQDRPDLAMLNHLLDLLDSPACSTFVAREALVNYLNERND